MAKEMDVSCNFIEKQLVCMPPNQMMDVLLKVCTKTGEHTFWKDVYACTLKYRRWNIQLRPFRSLKKRVANSFRKRNSISDNSRGISTQSIINYMERDSEERSVINDNKRNSVHSDWNDLIPMDVEAEYQRIYNIRNRPDNRSSTVPSAAPVAKAAVVPPSSPANTHKMVKNIVLVPYTPKPKEWGSWQVKKSQLASSTVTTPNSVYTEKEPEQEQAQEDLEQGYQPQNLYYSPVHPPEFYEDE